MNWVFISILSISALQIGVCGFSLPMFVSCIGRGLFLLRLIGSVIPVKVSLGFEAARLLLTFIALIFTKSGINWVSVLLIILFTGLVCFLYLIDDRLYLYVVEDDVEEEEYEE